MYLPFSKYHGAGNDFVIFDDRAGAFPSQNVRLIQRLCDRRLGIGADGVLLLQASSCAQFRMQVFNSDGREAGMCGNGIRCLIHYLRSLGFKEEQFSIETKHATIPCYIQGDKVCTKLGKPHVLHWGVKIEIEDFEHEAFVVNTGVPHAVIFLDDIESYPVLEIGRRIRHHDLFSPLGVNVNFARLLADGTVRMRTYERGVENETLACGTGAAAVALAAMQKWTLPNPIRVLTSARECLELYIHEAVDGGKEIALQGGSTFVFEGRVELDSMFLV